MTYTAKNPHADGRASPGVRPRYRPPRHSDLHTTSRTHDNWMVARQTSCCQQTAPSQPRCSKDVTAHPHRPSAYPGSPCPVPACSGQPQSGRKLSMKILTIPAPTRHTRSHRPHPMCSGGGVFLFVLAETKIGGKLMMLPFICSCRNKK